MDAAEALKELESHREGLTSAEASIRLSKYGLNQLQEAKKASALERFIGQFKDFMIMLLIAAALISIMLGEFTDAVVIIAILLANATLGFYQENKAEKSLEALKKLMAPEATILRDGNETRVKASELAPGDVVLLLAGDRVPADARIIEAMNLSADESSLTGESIPVKKQSKALEGESALADRSNMLYLGSSVTYGRAVAVVTSTGMNTEMGKIAGLVQAVEAEKTPLQARLDDLGRKLGVAALLICGLVFVVGILTGEGWFQMFEVSVSLAVAAVPEGLPAVVTISLAVGVQRMVKRHAIIRKLPAVETLGSATVICSDKTGTLTKNEMTVRRIYYDGGVFDVSGEGYRPEGRITREGEGVNPLEEFGLKRLVKVGLLCNDSSLSKKEDVWGIIGDPTEGALVVLAEKAGYPQSKRRLHPRVYELPFDSTRKMMTTLHDESIGRAAYVKGAPDQLIEKCAWVYAEGGEKPLTEARKKEILSVASEMAEQALRVLGMAYRRVPKDIDEDDYTPETIEKDLIFVGFVGMVDPPRPETREAVELCTRAGIRPIMVTGDHKRTAYAIAKEIGMASEDSLVLTGLDLDRMSDDELYGKIEEVNVFARVSPEHKMRIVQALKKRDHVVAMTGDGVNDAPALKMSDIGVAMGIAGTDVSKEASDMVLTDDNFASIVSAVEEGRGIYANIKKFVWYLLSCNVGEIFTVFFAIIIRVFNGWPNPLSPIQILWINIVTDGLPATALSVDPAEPDLMLQKPRPKKEAVMSKSMFYDMLAVGLLIGVGTLLIYNADLSVGVVKAQTMAFTTLVMFQIFNVLNSRSERHSLLKIGLFSNRYLVLAIISSMMLQCAVLYVPFLQGLFGTTALGLWDWVRVIMVSGTVFLLMESLKFFRRRAGRSG